MDSTTTTTISVQPHTPDIEGKNIQGLDLGGLPITNTILSTWIFMVCLAALIFVLHYALRNNCWPRIRGTGIIIVRVIDDFITDFIGGDRAFGRQFFFLFAGVFCYVFFANFFGLILDWLNLVSTDEWLTAYLRPINSDPNTTFVLSVLVFMITQAVAIRYRGIFRYTRGYLFNYSGRSTSERILNVFVGWIHLISEFTKILSLALSLFGNIFAGIVLLSVMAFLTSKLAIDSVGVGQLAIVPFWFFEIFVATVQAAVFGILMLAYLGDAKLIHEH